MTVRAYQHIAALAVLLFALGIAAPTQADPNLAARTAAACNSELKTFCSGVMVGGGRKLACLFAHNDRLSISCERAMYEASVELERLIAAVRTAAANCASDIDRFCSEAIPGKGRIVLCLAAHQPSLSPACSGTLAALQHGR